MSATPHPLDPLSPAEIKQAGSIVRASYAGQRALNFRVVTLREPIKKTLIPFLDSEHVHKVTSVKRPARIARAQVIATTQGLSELHELLVDLDQSKIIERSNLQGRHCYIDSDYMQAVEKACRTDKRVQAEIDTLDLPANATVVIEAWAYATDGENDMSERTTMCWFYMRLNDDPDANYYAYPLDICAEVSEQLKVTRVYRLPLTGGEYIHDEKRKFDRRREQPLAETEYHPSLRPSPRTTTKPLQVVQPEGVSFESKGNLVSWEKWRFRVGFNYREGMTLHDICYDNRSLFYRLSLAEMFVPYGDPRRPYPRKAAFDLGNDGAGINANNLKLGCDCLGSIRYFDGWHVEPTGEPRHLPNVICCHEQDDGILWKHTNFRTQNAVVARARILVLQTIITVSNYEYIFAFHFGQDASIHYEVRATGILSTTPIKVGEKVPYGTVVGPGTLAPYHQHLFCLRIDPAIDGHRNSLKIEESEAMPIDKKTNPLGVGYISTSTLVENEGALDLDVSKARTFKIVNESQINPITGTPVGYQINPHYSQMLLAHADSYHARRSEFGQHAIWITRYDDEEIFPAGRHTMQSMGGDGIASGIQRRAADKRSNTSVRNQDIVIWHTFGSTHNPRIEDWPVMPSEKMTVGLKASNFFTGNPGMDVAITDQSVNRSVLVQDMAVAAETCRESCNSKRSKL